MQGDLRDFNPMQLLRLVSLAKKSGTLKVEHRNAKAALSFKDGKLIFAAIGDSDGSLSSVLARTGHITREQAVSLAKHAERTSDKQLGLLLIQKGYVTQEDIVKSIKRHELASVNHFTGWREGRFAFDAAVHPDDGRITVPIDLENLIIQLARREKLDSQLEEEIPSLDVALKFVNRPNVKLSDLQLSKEEWRVLNYIKPENTIRMIANKLNMNERQIRRVVGSLREAGLVELVQIRRRDPMTAEQKDRTRSTVLRIIDRLQSIGAETQ